MEKIGLIRNDFFQTTEIIKENIKHLSVRGEKLQELEQKHCFFKKLRPDLNKVQ